MGTYKDPAFSIVPRTVKVGGRIEDGPQRYWFSPDKTFPKVIDSWWSLPWAIPTGKVTSATNITKGLEIIAMKELQPGVIRSCCREDRHLNNQIDIKPKATTEYLQLFIYYRVKGRGAHRPCLYMYGYQFGGR